MKILVVCQYYYPEPFRITDICESLVKRGHDVTVLTGLPNYPEGVVLQEYRHGNKREEILNGVKIIRCFEIGRGKNKIKLFLNYFSYALSATLKAIFMKEKFDVVLVNQLSPVMMGIPAMAYKKKHNKKILFYCLDLWPDSLAAGGIKEDSIIYKVFYKISKWIYKSADLILVTSSMFEEYFRNTLQINTVKIRHLPQYAEDLFVQNDKNSLNETAATTENNVYNFVFAGNIGDMQSVETIIKSANELKTIKNISFHIVGDGSKLDECKKLTEELKLQNIKYYGRKPVDDMPKFYDMADAMLITLKDNKVLSYTLPGKVQSYMAAGKPIIGAINGETRRVISKASCGFSCGAEDYKALADLIKRFCDSNEKEKMSTNAKKFYLDNFSKDKFMSVLDLSLKDLEA
ncbi:glycosyltransferase family 4 protein [Clostridium paridis]|uniref:Glycosyltransferase family 4 protein n=1 Tax=Clostridium paridis TaxID=2803863 RepID=A0A937FJD5_9CLOT|nr:glycosyltransferase family 4 protein [Clostridium paridis]MBL4932601.1 glycosyltransferase family 4 protein [Clostridium paridis]